MGFVLTMITSALILHEPQPLLRVVGTLVVTGGMVLVGLAR
jgi:multidrug transporter EmrE-like cation transporter